MAESGLLEELDTAAPLPPIEAPAPRFPRRPKLRIEAEDLVQSALARVTDIRDDLLRGEWMDRRAARYAKYRGWLPDKTYPWPGCSNQHVPLLQMAELRANAGLDNALQTMRPFLRAIALHPGHVDREEKITQLLDAQLFVDQGPEHASRTTSEVVSAFLQDGLALGYTPWVRDEREITTIHRRPAPPEGADPDAVVEEFITARWTRGTYEADLEHDNQWNVTVTPPDGIERDATVRVYEDEAGRLEFVVTEDAVLYDGPVLIPLAIESVYFPTRCTNLQPPAEWNPHGAPFVVIELEYRLDDLRRLQDSGKLNWLDEEGLEKIEASIRGIAGTRPGDGTPLREQKEAIEGRDHRAPAVEVEADTAHLPVRVWLGFDRWTLDGEFAEEIVWQMQPDAEVLMECRRLTELYPVTPDPDGRTRPYRPLAKGDCIPVPGQAYPMGLVEIGETLQDLVKGILDQTLDSAAITKMPFFFYSISSKLSPDIVQLGPGEGMGVPGDPKAAVYFPNIPQGDLSWALQFIGLGFQMFERLLMIGDLQLGRVPQGKASALRTYGTTAALLQQGDVRADQMLLRLFGFYRQVALHFHRLNRALLPNGKELRLLGHDGPREEGYLTIKSADVDADMDFDFKPDVLNSSPQTQALAVQEMLQLLATPLAMQMGIFGPPQFYALVRDFAKARRLDYQRYMTPPQGEEPILAKDAINTILAGELPTGMPAEGAQRHLQAVQAFIASDEVAFTSPKQQALIAQYLQVLQMRVQQEQQMMMAAQQFGQAGGGAMGGNGASGAAPGSPPGLGEGLGTTTAPEGGAAS